MPRSAIFTFLLAFSVLCLFSTENALAFHAQYDQTVTLNEEKIGTFKVAITDDRMRTESELGGLKTILIKNESGSFSYRPKENMALKIPEAILPGVVTDLENYRGYLIEHDAKKIGTEKIDGYDCDVYQFSEPNTSQNAQAWVWQKRNFPIRVEVESPQGKMIVEFSNINLDEQPAADLFILPESVQINDFTEAF